MNADDDTYSDESKKALGLDANVEQVTPQVTFAVQEPQPQYRLYKRRWAGLFALFFLNIISGAAWPWFGPISLPTAERFGFSTTQVNWLGNAVSLTFLPVSIFVPVMCGKLGVRNTCLAGAVFLLVSSWLRYAGTSDSLSSSGKYALMLISQMMVGVPQPIYQIVGPKYSEIWFDLNFRTTATMIIAVSNPLGSGLGQLLSPILSDPKNSVLLLGVIGTVIAPLALLVSSDPPIPPTHAASAPPQPALAMFRAMVGKERPGEPSMDIRERIDFVLLTIIFGLCVENVSSFSLLSNEILEPYGYSSDQAGFVGGALLFSGIVAAILAAPLLDRVLTHHLGLAIRVLLPILAAAWIGFIFAVRRNGIGGLFANVVIVGVSSLILLPVGLEIGVEVTRAPETSSAVLWFVANMLNIIFVPILHALRAPDNADPPRNFRNGLILNAALMAFAAVLVFGIRGKQKRRELDIQMMREREAQTVRGPRAA